MSVFVRRRMAVLSIAAAVVVVLVVTSGSDETPHRVFATVKDANNMLPGQDIRQGGSKVGTIGDVEVLEGGRSARVELKLADAAWPLRRGTKLQLRWGGTVNFNNRYLALTPGPPSGRTISENASLPAGSLSVPVEYDQLVKSFTPEVRSDLRRLLNNGGPALDAARQPLKLTLGRTPPALSELGTTLHQVVGDPDRLDLLVRSAASTVSAIDEAEPGLRELVTAAGSTLSATGAEARNLEATLDAAPATFTNIRDTLKRADPTLRTVGHVAQRLAPGVTQLRAITPPLNHVLSTVVEVGPDATSSLRTARDATKSLNPLLSKATALMPDIASVGKQATEQLTCLRPYTPDAVGFLTNWGDFISSTDGRDHYFRAFPQVLLAASTNVQSYDSAQAAKLFPGLTYAFPRPPGSNAGKPWFQPSCGITEDAYNPAKDPESRTSVPKSESLPERSQKGTG